MDDKELLELAARAVGIEVTSAMRELWGFDGSSAWNPLTDDGDALRLAVKLRLNVNFEEWDGAEYACAVPHRCHQGWDEVLGDDENADTRRAIVRAAAELGKNMVPNETEFRPAAEAGESPL